MKLAEGIQVALVSGVFAVAVVLIEKIISPPSINEPKLVSFFSQNIPVGTIVSSSVNPKLFSKFSGGSGGFDPINSTWVPADGRDVPGSKYDIEVTTDVPDLRGMFIRGLNYSDETRVRDDGYQDPEADRSVRSIQDDSFEGHDHGQESGSRIVNFESGGGWETVSSGARHFSAWKSDGDVETRPNNVALFYYIKIN